MKGTRIDDVSLGVLIGLSLFGSTCGAAACIRDYRRELQARPSQVYVLEADLNYDGIPDVVVQQGNGYNVPLYGVQSDEFANGAAATKYVPAGKMIQQSLGGGRGYRRSRAYSEVSAFYYGIEERLNK